MNTKRIDWNIIFPICIINVWAPYFLCSLFTPPIASTCPMPTTNAQPVSIELNLFFWAVIMTSVQYNCYTHVFKFNLKKMGTKKCDNLPQSPPFSWCRCISTLCRPFSSTPHNRLKKKQTTFKDVKEDILGPICNQNMSQIQIYTMMKWFLRGYILHANETIAFF